MGPQWKQYTGEEAAWQAAQQSQTPIFLFVKSLYKSHDTRPTKKLHDTHPTHQLRSQASELTVESGNGSNFYLTTIVMVVICPL